MRRRLATLTFAALAALAGLSATASEAAAPRPVPVGIASREYSLSLYRPVVAPGLVSLNLTNFGEDGHDLAVLSPTGKPLGRLAEVASRGRGSLTLRLAAPGRYTLLCTLPGHAAKGMRAKLIVRR